MIASANDQLGISRFVNSGCHCGFFGAVIMKVIQVPLLVRRRAQNDQQRGCDWNTEADEDMRGGDHVLL